MKRILPALIPAALVASLFLPAPAFAWGWTDAIYDFFFSATGQAGSTATGSESPSSEGAAALARQRQTYLANADQEIASLTRFRDAFEKAGLPEDVALFEAELGRYQAHREVLQGVGGQEEMTAALKTFYPDVVSEEDTDLDRKKVRMELPEKFDRLARALARSIPDDSETTTAGAEPYGVLYADMDQLNRSLQELSLHDRVTQGPEMIGQFVEGHQGFFDKIFRSERMPLPLGGRGGLYELGGDVAVGVQAIKPKAQGHPMSHAPRSFTTLNNALVIIVDDWLKADPNFSKQNVIDIPHAHALVPGVLDRVDKAYLEMSYGKEHWKFDTCRIESTNVGPGTTDETRIYAALTLCVKRNFTLSDYNALILWPGTTDFSHADVTTVLNLGPNQEPQKICPIWVSTSPFGSEEFIGSHIFPLGPFSEYPIGHELGHCLGLWHTAAYDCGNKVYGPGCSDSYTAVYGGKNVVVQLKGLYDLMGTFDNQYYVNSLFPHFNCLNKGKLGWAPSVPVGVGQHRISALEPLLAEAPRCLVLPVDQKLPDPKAPCEGLFIEYRMPRKFAGAVLGGLAAYCKTPADIVGGRTRDFWSEGKLLDCTPGSQINVQNDVADSLISNQTCHTGLGYDISFGIPDIQKLNLGSVTITSTLCPDKDGDGYRNPFDGKGNLLDCDSSIKPDCDDANKDINPGIDESKPPYACNGKDDNCDGITDGRKNNGEFCMKCSETDNGDDPKASGTTTQTNGLGLQLEFKDACQDQNTLTENYCEVGPHESLWRQKSYDCRAVDVDFICYKGECIKAPNCPDKDGDGYQDPNDPPGCKLTTKPDCNDGDDWIHPGQADRGCNGGVCKDDNCDGILCGDLADYDQCPQCIDTDHGKEPRVGGVVIYWSSHGQPFRSESDSCDEGSKNNMGIPVQILEWWCLKTIGPNGGIPAVNYFDCRQWGMRCFDPDGAGPMPADCRF